MQFKHLVPWLLVIGGILAIAPAFLINYLDQTPNTVRISDSQTVKIFQSQKCEVKTIADGDTIACADGTKVRFCGIDSPELAQPLGQESKQNLTNLLQGREVFISPIKQDRYGRTVAEVFVRITRNEKQATQQSEEELFANAEMVRAGMAFHYAQYSNSCPGKSQIVDAENQAKAGAIGVWSNPNYQKPWDYRRANRN